LLRRTGGGWIFIHDELREHLAGIHVSGALSAMPETLAPGEKDAVGLS
jgi:hypothetical protein